MTTCKNCDTSFEGRFCPNCSQKADTHRFTINHLLHEFFHAFTHTDKGILFLIKELAVRPGQTIREYTAGKRKKYFNPITFLLIASALQLFAIKKTDIFHRYTESVYNVTQQLVKASGAKISNSREMDELKTGADASMTTMLENNKIITLLFIPALGFLTWLFFRKSKFNYAENLILNIMISAELSIFFLFACILPFIIFPSYVILWMILFLLINSLYSIIVYKRFFHQRWFISIVKGLAIQIIFMILTQLVFAQFLDLIK